MQDGNRVTAPIPTRGFTSKSLHKAIFDADLPEQFVRSIPAQSLYMVIKQNGLASSSDVLEIATLEQCRLLLDFDLWEKDRLNEENFWEWLGVCDAENNLELLQKIVKCLDLKLVGLLIMRYVLTETFEEPTDNPPGPSYYTPDKGFTWIFINVEDSHKHFLLGRLLAMLFETNADLFYQLLSIPGVSTDSTLEEDSFQEKSKRLAAEGIPSLEWAGETHAALDEISLKKLLATQDAHIAVNDIPAIEPLVYESQVVQPLASLFANVPDRELFESELTLITNAALVHFAVPAQEFEAVRALIMKVRGAINIGLETALRLCSAPVEEIYKKLGLQPLYRHGITKLMHVRKTARVIFQNHEQRILEDAGLSAVFDQLRQPFPDLPFFFDTINGVIDEQKLGESAMTFDQTKPLEHDQEWASIKNFLQALFPA